MKKVITTLIVVLTTLSIYAQISDVNAKLKYQQAEDAYNNLDYLKASNLLSDLMKEMRSETPKVVYLLLKSYTKSLEKGTSNENYKDLDLYSSLSTRFLEKIKLPALDYPAEKVAEIKSIQTYLLQLQDKYVVTKDRTPQDAINFLNECAKKFCIDNSDNCTLEYSLEGSNLIVSIFQKQNLSRYTSKRVEKMEIKIDLSKVWIEYKSIYVYRSFEPNDLIDHIFNSYFYIDRSGSSLFESIRNAPVVVSSTTNTYKKLDYENILVKHQADFDKYYRFDYKSYAKTSFRSMDNKLGYYIYSFLNERNPEFKEENYKERIKRVYEFLMRSFGGGEPEPVEKPKEKESKF